MINTAQILIGSLLCDCCKVVECSFSCVQFVASGPLFNALQSIECALSTCNSGFQWALGPEIVMKISKVPEGMADEGWEQAPVWIMLFTWPHSSEEAMVGG